MTKRTSFNWSDEVEPHKLRTKTIIKQHPEIRALIGRNPYTFFDYCTMRSGTNKFSMDIKGCILVVEFSRSLLYWRFACHTLYVCIHECSHNLVFKNRTLNTLSSILANLPMIFPSAVSFTKYHLKHHSYQGVEELDADMPYRWEARLINNSTVGKAVWLLFYPIFQAIRPARLKEIKLIDTWTIINLVIQVIFTAAIVWLLGVKALVFLVLSLFFSVGLHPLGARWVQEHFLTHGDHQETKSYYGPMNVVNLNVGYHNEHHDFPSIPWNKLPKLKSLADDHYENLGYHRSYTMLLFQFLFNKDISVYSRTARSNRGKKSAAVKATTAEA